MIGKISVSPSSEKSMASSTTPTTTTVSTEDSEGRDGNCYFPYCRKDANCNCEICLDSLNATLDLMPLSVQKSSLTKLSYATSNFVKSTPTSFDPNLVTTPPSVKVIPLPMKKKKKEEAVKKSEVPKSRICVVLKVVLVIGLVLGLKLGFRLVCEGGLKPEFTEEIVRHAGLRSLADHDLDVKIRILEDELKVSSCRDSGSKWKINQDGSLLNSKCVLYKSFIEEVSIWGWPLQTAGMFHTGLSSSSFTILSGRVTEWAEGKFSFSIRETNTSWVKDKWSTSVLQLDPNTWVLEYRSSVIDGSSLMSVTMDLLKHMMSRAAKSVKGEAFWMFSASGNYYREAESEASTMTPT